MYLTSCEWGLEGNAFYFWRVGKESLVRRQPFQASCWHLHQTKTLFYIALFCNGVSNNDFSAAIGQRHRNYLSSCCCCWPLGSFPHLNEVSFIKYLADRGFEPWTSAPVCHSIIWATMAWIPIKQNNFKFSLSFGPVLVDMLVSFVKHLTINCKIVTAQIITLLDQPHVSEKRSERSFFAVEPN